MGVIRWNLYYEISNRKLEFGHWTLIDNWIWPLVNEEIVKYRQHTVYFATSWLNYRQHTVYFATSWLNYRQHTVYFATSWLNYRQHTVYFATSWLISYPFYIKMLGNQSCLYIANHFFVLLNIFLENKFKFVHEKLYCIVYSVYILNSVYV